NLQEYQNNTDPNSWDTDGDGISDYDEVYKTHTNPLQWSSGGDGIADGAKFIKVNVGISALTQTNDEWSVFSNGALAVQNHARQFASQVIYLWASSTANFTLESVVNGQPGTSANFPTTYSISQDYNFYVNQTALYPHDNGHGGGIFYPWGPHA